MKLKAFLALCTILFLIPGCSHRVYVASNAYADSELIPYGFPIGASFSITAGKGPHHNTMLSKEISRKIAHILIANDYTVVDEGPADYELFFNYGMESSIQTRETLAYVPGTTQVTHGVALGTCGPALYQEQTSTPGAFVTVPEQYTLYERTLNINVYTAQKFTKNKKREKVWQISTISTGETGDLRETIDYLLASAFKHFGENTRGQILEKHIVG